MRTREEHLAWCKERALEYLDHGQLVDAVTSMSADLTKHPETNVSATPTLMMAALLYVRDGDEQAVRRWIEGFR